MASGGTILKTKKQPSAEIRVTPLRIPDISVVPQTLLIRTNSEASGKMGYEISESGRYTGKDYDEATGLYYYNARWYDAALGRFLTEDPARDGANWYVYVRNNPLRYVDPTGLRIIKDNDETGRPVTETGKEVGERYRRNREDREQDRQEKEREKYEAYEGAWESYVADNTVFNEANPLNQEFFDARYGYSSNETASCQTCAIINFYIAKTSNGITLGVLDRIVSSAKGNSSLAEDGSPNNFSVLSQTIAKAIGMDSYYDYNYPSPDKTYQTMSADEYSRSGAEGGIIELKNIRSERRHFVASVGKGDNYLSIDSLDENRSAAKDYTITNIRPLFQYRLGK